MKTRLLFLAVLAPALYAIVPVNADRGMVVHEWGTFTSAQGADGIQLSWNPHVAPDLPSFVYDPTRPEGGKGLYNVLIAGKAGMVTRQRMETPVLYFYNDSDRVQTLDVSIKFPGGIVTEWYPQKSAAIPSANLGLRTDQPALHWPKVEVLSKVDSAAAVLPVDPSGSHYFAARETDATVLRLAGEKQKAEFEKFLFYRGVASFQAPLTVKIDGPDRRRLSLTNTGPETLRSLFIYEVRPGGGGAWVPMENLKPAETRTLRLETEAGGGQLTALARTLTAALAREGLYEREAAAMVKTWESSWFAEPGVRVLYTLPRAFTDRTLPLAIQPAPAATERVMVARAEIIMPEVEDKLVGLIHRYILADAPMRASIVKETQGLGLGRFTDAAVRRVATMAGQQSEFASGSWELLQAVNAASSVPVKATAAR